MLREDTAAVTVLSTLVRMPQYKHGSRQAIEHWRGSAEHSPRPVSTYRPPWAVVSERYRKMQDTGKRKDNGGSSRQIAGLPVASINHWERAFFESE